VVLKPWGGRLGESVMENVHLRALASIYECVERLRIGRRSEGGREAK
jgi:hypothetical protein